MRKYSLFLLTLGTLLVIGGTVLAWSRGSDEDVPVQEVIQPAPVVGAPAPDFELVGLDGEIHRLSDYEGKVILLNLWATWCAPCREEMPMMEDIYQRYAGQGFEILALNQAEPPSYVKPFVEELGLNFPILLDGHGRVGIIYRLVAYPSTYIIGRDGVIREFIYGKITDEAALEELIQALLEET